jgi:hypothetical protein
MKDKIVRSKVQMWKKMPLSKKEKKALKRKGCNVIKRR